MSVDYVNAIFAWMADPANATVVRNSAAVLGVSGALLCIYVAWRQIIRRRVAAKRHKETPKAAHLFDRGAVPSVSGEPFLQDFSTSISETAFDYACEALNLKTSGRLSLGFSRRSLSGVVSDAYGHETWLKVTALRGEKSSRFREGESAAPLVEGVSRPAIFRIHDWQDAGLRYRAVQTSLAGSPAVELTPLAGMNAARVTDAWIEEFKRSVHRLGTTNTDRFRFHPDAVEAHVKYWFGAEAPYAAEQFSVAHGDAHWGNLTYPNLMFLDWELWGLAPRGFDLAYLVTFSCTDSLLAQRLEAAFEEELTTKAGKIAHLIALGEFLNLIKEGFFPRLHEHSAMQMAQRVLRRR
jgi:hypothetical protein